jgi:glycosyltransferase involved in cell wall biosynthesis
MNILWFVDKQFDASLSRVTHLETFRYLQRNNNIFPVVGFRKSRCQFPELRNNVIYLHSPKIKYLKRIGFYWNQIKNFKSFVLKYQPTTIVFNTDNFLLLIKAARLKKRYNYRCFFDVRTLPVSSKKAQYFMSGVMFKYALIIAVRFFDGITYITEEIKSYCKQKFNLPDHESEIWTSGVNINLFKPKHNDSAKDSFKIIYHGSISENRGLQNAVKALAHIKDQNVELNLLGEGNGLNELKRLSYELGLERRVVFFDSVPYYEVPKYIQAADVGILPFPDWPGWNTSSPQKLFEYLACGKPVIVTRIPAHTNVLKGSDFAFWAESSSPEAIASAIVKAFNSKDKFEAIGTKARQLVVEKYSWESQAQRLEGFLDRKNK